MKRSFTLLLCYAFCVISFAQVKSSYQYNTSMPYGTLDIRTKISSTNYFYLQEGKTFAYRESAPGVKTNSFLDMTAWGDSGPYQQGNLRQKNGSADKFIMNYRTLFPVNYNASYAEGYPLIVIVHGAVERGNCYYDNCYHSNWSYDPNVNSPAAPTTATHKLLNNDHHLNIGGKQHLDARNLAGSRLPNDPAMPSRAFPGFVIMPQMLNVWDSLNIQDLIRIVRLHCEKYKIDQNRVYIHGLSIGGYGVYEAIKRAPWLFTAALPMSAVKDANIFKHNQQAKIAHMPIWVFQGGKDTGPTPAYTNTVISNFQKAGAVVRYSLYADLTHNVWNRAYGEKDFFTWMLTKSKANIHPYNGNTVIIKSKSQYPKLMLAEGFLAYQWEKNGVVISTAKSNTYTATTPGTYRARFSRLSSAPSETQWNKWSAPVTITETTTTTMASTAEVESIVEEISVEEVFSISLYPNPATPESVNLQVNTSFDGPVDVRVFDQMGKEHYNRSFDVQELQSDQTLSLPSLTSGIYILWVNQGRRQLKQKLMIRD